MKILLVLQDALPEHAGPVALHTHQLALALQRRKHEVLVLSAARDPARAEGTITEDLFDGVRTLRRVQRGECSDVRASWVDARADQDFARLLEHHAPDVVHFHHLGGWGPRCLAIARDEGAVVVATLHDHHALCERGTLLTAGGEPCARAGQDCARCLDAHPLDPPAEGEERTRRHVEAQRERRVAFQRGLAQAHAVVALSRSLVRTSTQAGLLTGSLVEILSPGTHGPTHKPRVRRGGKLRLGFAGGVQPEDGLAVLIAAVRSLGRAPVELSVHGPVSAGAAGPERAELERLATGLALTFHDAHDARAFDRACAGFDVLVVPSLAADPHPLPILDAFRNGLPVIATTQGGTSEAVHDGINGLLFPRGDARALGRCIGTLLADPELYNRLTRDRPPTVTVDAVAERLERLYARFVVQRPPARAGMFEEGLPRS